MVDYTGRDRRSFESKIYAGTLIRADFARRITYSVATGKTRRLTAIWTTFGKLIPPHLSHQKYSMASLSRQLLDLSIGTSKGCEGGEEQPL